MWHRCLTNNGNGGGMKKTLLWTNPAPTAEFSAKTITLNLTDYDYVMITPKYNLTSGIIDKDVILKKDNGEGGYTTIGAGNPASAGAAGSRKCKVLDTGVIFEKGYNPAAVETNTHAIPLAIYGLRGEIT